MFCTILSSNLKPHGQPLSNTQFDIFHTIQRSKFDTARNAFPNIRRPVESLLASRISLGGGEHIETPGRLAAC
jgi:hypothetical protein